MDRVEISHQFSMSPKPMESGYVISELSFPGYRDQVSKKLPDAFKLTNKDEANAQIENTFKLIDRLANKYQAMARILGYVMDDDVPHGTKE